MKIKLVIMLCCAGNLSANALFSQQVTLDVAYNNRTVLSVLDDLKAQTGYTFFHLEDVIAKDERVSVNLRGATIEQILDKVLTDNGYDYKIQDKVVIITARQLSNSQNSSQQRQTPIKVEGRVLDYHGHPIVGASVVISNSSIGVATDTQGRFSITVPDRGTILTISFLGKKAQSVEVKGNEPLTVTLEDDVKQLDDVVVTGIFTRARESYTGAVSEISTRQLQTYRGQNMLQTLRNIDPAFNIVENNDLGSNPNILPNIQIRGNSSLPTSVEEFNATTSNVVNRPLIIMDGFEISLEKLMDYNDEEVEKITLLKDAAATAIYGSRGANGVVVVTTKVPQLGKLRVSFKAGISLEIPDLTSYDLMNAREKLEYENKIGLYSSSNPLTHVSYQQKYNQRLKAINEGVDTYWLSQPLHVGIGQNYNLRFEGGREEFRWSASAGFRDVQGAMKGSERRNFNGAITLSYIYKDLTFRNHTEIGVNRSQESPYGTFSDYSSQQPYNAPYDKEGNLVESFESFYPGGLSKQNPLYNATLSSFDKSAYTEIVNNFSIEWKILPELILRGQFGISHKGSDRDKYLSPEHSSFSDLGQNDALRKGTYDYTRGKDNSYDGQLTLNYTKMFANKHMLTAGLNYSIAESSNWSSTFRGEGFTNDSGLPWNAVYYPQTGSPSGSESTSRRVGFTANVNYSFDNRFFADASVRADGSSQFGSKNRFAPFWSMGIGWNIHREHFFADSNVVNNLRLRLSYGETGSQNFNPYQALSMYQYYSNTNYGVREGAYLVALANDRLKWQVTDSYNTGLDFGFFNNRINGSFDVYMKETGNLLSAMDIPYATGFASYTANVGKVRNTGFEAAVSGYIIRDTERHIVLIINGKLTYNKNRIVKLSEEIKRQTESYLASGSEVSSLFYEGRPQNSIYAVRSLGIDPSTGEEIYLDADGNPTFGWSASDKVWLGANEPLWRGNAGVMFTYKNLTLNLSFAYHWGGVKYNQTLLSRVEITSGNVMSGNVDRRVDSQRWSESGDVVFFKKMGITGTRASSRFVMDDKVFSLQSANLQYRLNADYLKKAGIESLLVSLNTSDLFYLSSIKRERGLSYPFTRSLSANITLLF